MKKYILVIVLLLGPLAWMAVAQNTTPSGDPGTEGHGPKPPIFTVLDMNQDGIISADEIAKASVALKTLDKNGDGKLTPDEYRPPRPGGSGGPGGSPKAEGSHSQSSEAGRPPKPPIDLALDVNQDGIISADEIAKASASLKKLDKNSDGKLTPEECLPTRPKISANSQPKG